MTVEPIEAPAGMMVQWAPFPTILLDLVRAYRYKPGWSFTLHDITRDQAPTPPDVHWSKGAPLAGGLTFTITTHHQNAYPPHEVRPTNHHFVVPAATFNRDSWQRWILQRCLDVDLHEAAEWGAYDYPDTADERPFAPTHGPGDDPYRVVQYATDLQRRTAFTGKVNEPRFDQPV